VLNSKVVDELNIATFELHRQAIFQCSEMYHIQSFRLNFRYRRYIMTSWRCRGAGNGSAREAEAGAFAFEVEQERSRVPAWWALVPMEVSDQYNYKL
jgi:hypothetical protein